MEFLFRFKMPFLTLLCFVFCQFDVDSQNKATTEYLDSVGDYAVIYSGRVEAIYNLNQYENLPYYKNKNFILGVTGSSAELSIKQLKKNEINNELYEKNSDFTPGEMVYKNKFYPNLQLRLDLYKEQLITLSPEKHYGIVLESKDVQKATFYGKTFIWYDPIKAKDLKSGFYMQLHKGDSLILLCKIYQSLNKGLTSSNFNSKTNFYLSFKGDYYTVKNKKSFTKIFPQFKNQINQFVKEHKLEFGSDSERSLTLLAQYCESLFLGNI